MTKPLNRTREEAVLRVFPTPGTIGTDVGPVRKRRALVNPPATYALPKVKDAAGPAERSDWKGTTYVPARVSPLRPGSEDFLLCPSRIGDEYFYPLGKPT